MSSIQASTVQTIAHSVDIARLSDDGAKMLALDVEQRLREVMQVGWVCYRRLHAAACNQVTLQVAIPIASARLPTKVVSPVQCSVSST